MSHATLDPPTVEQVPDGVHPDRHEVVRDPLWRATVLGVVAGLLSRIDGLPSVAQLVLLLAFVCLAPGGAVLLWWRGLSPAARGGLTPVLGLSVVVLATTLQAFNRLWNPSAVVWGLVVASAASAAVALAVRRSPARAAVIAPTKPAGTNADVPPVSPVSSVEPAAAADADAEAVRSAWSWRTARPSLVVLALAVVAWLICLPRVGHARVSAWGLLAAASPALLVALVLTIAGGLLAMRQRSATGLVAATLVMIAVQRLTIALSTEVPLYPWVYKHLAVVDYIDRFHFVVRGTDIYHNWPGLFTLTAWADELTGVSPMAMAHWFTPVYHLAMLPLVYAAARAWRRPPLVAAATAFVFEALSFIAQDYFSPQALAYLLSIGVVLGLGEAAYRRAAALPVLILFAGVVVTHQLTPYWLILVAVGLVLLRRVKSWWLPVAFAAMALGFIYFNYAVVQRYGAVTNTDPLQNIRLTKRAVPLLGFASGFWGTIACYAIMFGTAAVVLGIRLLSRRSKREWRAPAVLAFAPVLLLAVQGYGGEAIFRVFLYALPGLAPVFATVLVRAAGARLRVWAPVAVLAVLACFASAQSYLGPYSAYRIERSQVELWQTYNRTAPIGSYLYSLGPGLPGNWEWYYAPRTNRNGGGYASSLFSADSKVESDFDTDAQYDDFMALFTSRLRDTTVPIYITVSDGEQNYAEINGVLPPHANQNLRRHLSTDPRWQLVTDLGSAALFRLAAS